MLLLVIRFLTSVYTIIGFSTNKTENLDSLYKNAREFVNKDPDRSITLCNELIEKSSRNKKIEVKAHYLLGFNYYLKGQPVLVYKHAKQAINLAEKNNYKEGEALGYRMLGTQYAKLGLLDKSEEAFKKALKLLEKTNTDEANEIRGMLYSSILILMDDTTPNLQPKILIAKKAILAYQEVSDSSRKKQLLVSAYTNLGYLYAKEEKHDSAQYAFRESLKRVAKEDYYLKAAIYHDMAYALQQ